MTVPTNPCYSAVLFPKDHVPGGNGPAAVNPCQGRGSPAGRTLASLLFVAWLPGALFVLLVFFGSLSWDRSFGHPPYAIWAGTLAYAIVGLLLFRGSHRSAKAFAPLVDRLRQAGFAPELELVGAECYAGFSRAQNRIVTLDNVRNLVTELPLSDVDRVEIQPGRDHNGWVIIDLLTRRLDLPRVVLKAPAERLPDWKARLRVVLALDGAGAGGVSRGTPDGI